MNNKIDPQLFKNTNRRGHRMKHCVYYDPKTKVIVLDDDKLEKLKPVWNTNSVCFAGVSRDVGQFFTINKPKQANRIMYIIQEGDIPQKDQLEWIKLSVKNGTLPEYILDQEPNSDRFVLSLKDVSNSLLYIYLSTLRNMQEDVQFIQTILTLVTKYKMDYPAALVVASKFNIDNNWHSIIDLGRTYGDTKSIVDLAVPVSVIVALTRYLKDPSKYDNRRFSDNMYPLRSKERIYKATGLFYDTRQLPTNACCRAEQLLDPIVKKAIKAKSDKEVISLMKSAGIKL
jgi:hypothetical protein